METILKCYFDNVFCDLSRSSLLSWQKRREITEYFSTVIEACVDAGECTLEEGCRTAVACTIDYHNAAKVANNSVCLLGKFHNVLYLAVKLSYDHKLNDTPLVAKLLQEIFSCEGTFERMFAGAIFGVRVCHFIAGWKSDFRDQEENILAVAYFLEHATKARVVFNIAGENTRLLDVPLTSVANATPLHLAVQTSRSDLVLMLLQLGISLDGMQKESSPVATLLKQISDSDYYQPESLNCFKFVLRSIPSIVAPHSSQSSSFHNSCFDMKLVCDKIIPRSRCGIVPPELKHLCRCAIRDILYSQWRLPFGIYELPLPVRLMKYLNLLED